MKQLNTKVTVFYKNGTNETFETIEQASDKTGLSINAIKSRANKPGSGSKSKDGMTFEWADLSVKRSLTAKKNRKKGQKYELDIIHQLTNLGFKGLKSSRSESKNLDNAKIDIAETEDKLSCYIQCKATSSTPNIESIIEACSLKDRPLVIFWKKQKVNEKQPEFVLLTKDYFYKLLVNYEQKSNTGGNTREI